MIGHVLWQMFDWPSGNVLGNLLATALCVAGGWFLALRHLHCAQSRCFRPGHHKVEGTTYQTCRKHTTKPAHDALKARHAEKYPEQHGFLAGGETKERDHHA